VLNYQTSIMLCNFSTLMKQCYVLYIIFGVTLPLYYFLQGIYQPPSSLLFINVLMRQVTWLHVSASGWLSSGD
jgi:hypothetical protein